MTEQAIELKGIKITQEVWTVEDWIRHPDDDDPKPKKGDRIALENPDQRDTEKHLKSALKTHLKKLEITHCRVPIGRLKSRGKIIDYKLDAHTRALAWKEEKLERPDFLVVDVYHLQTIKQVKELYHHFDNAGAVMTAGDQFTSALKRNGIDEKSEFWTRTGGPTAVRILYGNRARKVNLIDAVRPFKEELKIICGDHNLNRIQFNSMMLMALIMSVHWDGEEALDFWHAYGHNEGLKNKTSHCAVYGINRYVEEIKSNKQWTGSVKFSKMHLPKIMGYYERWGDTNKISKLEPLKYEKDFVKVVQKYLGDIENKLAWKGTAFEIFEDAQQELI